MRGYKFQNMSREPPVSRHLQDIGEAVLVRCRDTHITGPKSSLKTFNRTLGCVHVRVRVLACVHVYMCVHVRTCA